MKKICMVLVLWVLILLTACSVNNVSPETSGVPANMTKLTQGMWPRNEYTDGVPKPEKGTVVNGWIDSKNEYCYIELANMDEIYPQQYIKSLMEAGFEEAEKVSEQIMGQGYVSVGAVFTNGKKGVSISYMQERMGIYISSKGLETAA